MVNVGSQAELRALVSGLPNGARGFVLGGEEGVGAAHAFNAVNIEGEAVFLDAQIGAPAELKDMTRFFFLQTN